MIWKDALKRIDRDSAIGMLAALNVVSLRAFLKEKIDSGWLADHIAAEEKRLQSRSTAELRADLTKALYSRARADPKSDEQAADIEVLQQAARGVGLKPDGDSHAALEDRLLDKVIRRFLESAEKDESFDPGRLTDDVKRKLTPEEWRDLCEAMGSDRITVAALGKIMRDTAAGGAFALGVNAAGFGAYVTLTTAMSSIAGLAGATLPFAAYMGATSALSALSGPFIVVPLFTVGSWRLSRASRDVSRSLLAQTLVMLRLAVGPSGVSERKPTADDANGVSLGDVETPGDARSASLDAPAAPDGGAADPGWYEHEGVSERLRYWDGSQWTNRTTFRRPAAPGEATAGIDDPAETATAEAADTHVPDPPSAPDAAPLQATDSDQTEDAALARAYAAENDALRARIVRMEEENEDLRVERNRLLREIADEEAFQRSKAATIDKILKEMASRGPIDGALNRRFDLSRAFVRAVESRGSRYRPSVIRVCADVVLGAPSLLERCDEHPLREGSGPEEPQRVRRRDGARAFKCSIQKNAAGGRRLHYWRRTDGSIEFASINFHEDMNIPE